jgi:hypothetical protein
MSASKTGAYPSEAPFRCPHLGLDPGLTCQQSTSPERFAGDKHYSLFNIIIKYVCKGFYNISPWCKGYKTFFIVTDAKEKIS